MSNETTFIIFCLENYKVHCGLNGHETYSLFEQYGVLDYLHEFYDVLHTTGHNYINNDIDSFLAERGYTTAAK